MIIDERSTDDALTERRRRELGRFLRDCRTRTTPEAVGLSGRGRRHVKGLRREEVAELAGISFATYASIEQGRSGNVSIRTLSRVADVLGFSLFERQHIATLAGPPEVGQPLIEADFNAYINFVRSYPLGCAHMGDQAMDLVAYNDAADELFGFSRVSQPNLLVAMIENSELRWRLKDPDWHGTLTAMIGTFRLLYGTYPTSRAMEVVERLQSTPFFAKIWSATGILSTPLYQHRVDHPRYGMVRMQLLPVQCPQAPTMIVMLTTNLFDPPSDPA